MDIRDRIIAKQDEYIEYFKNEIKFMLVAIKEEGLEKGFEIDFGDEIIAHIIESEITSLKKEQQEQKPAKEITDEEIEKWAENYENNRIGILGQHIVSMQHKSGLVEGAKAMRDNEIG